MDALQWLFSFVLITFVLGFSGIHSCNKALCGSVVSKCLITHQCDCDNENNIEGCTCCENCARCIGELFHECCHCLDLCPEKSHVFDSEDAVKSHIEIFPGTPELFDIFIMDPEEDKWTVYNLLRLENVTVSAKHLGNYFQQIKGPLSDKEKTLANCSVIYMSSCTTSKKCLESCESVGAGGYRWFFDGCCECFGSNCANNGIDKSQCGNCPNNEVDDPSMIDYNLPEDYDIGREDVQYGEYADSYNYL